MLLPFPISAHSLQLGLLLANPLEPDHNSILSEATPSGTTERTRHPYEAAFHWDDFHYHDHHRRFVLSINASTNEQTASDEHVIYKVRADHKSSITLESPNDAFNAIREDTAVQSFLRAAARQNVPLYYITGLETLGNATFMTNNLSISLKSQHRVSSVHPMFAHNDIVISMEVRKVRCFIDARAVPHSVGDIEYSFSYHDLGDGQRDERLSVGLHRKDMGDDEANELFRILS
jgi:hypothetical protein